MISDPTTRLRAANPEPWCEPPPIDEVWRRIEAEGRGTQTVPGGSGAAGTHATAAAVIALSSLALVIAVGAIALLSRGREQAAGAGGETQQLVAQLAVLRRAQTAVDVLPSRLHIASPLSPPGKIIPRLTRLVRTLPDARLYMVVTTPSTDSLWSPRLGDQVSIVEVSGGHATETVPIPAADLTNADEVSDLTPDGLGARTPSGDYYVGIVPDGVARVRWRFANERFTPGKVTTAPVAGNVAVVPARADTPPPVLSADWYASNGRRVPTSNRASLDAQAAQDAALKAKAIRDIRLHTYHASPSLLSAFSVFGIISRTGVRTPAGNIISHPPLSALPLAIVLGEDRPEQSFELDFSQVRLLVTPSGARVYVIPGGRGLCLVAGDGSSSCNLLAQVKSHGMFFSSGSRGASTTYEIVPKTFHQITVRTQRGTRSTIPVPDGIYVSPPRHTHG